MKREHAFLHKKCMKYLNHVWNELVQNFTCESLIYDTYFTYEMEHSQKKINLTNEIFIYLWNLNYSHETH